MGGDRVETRQHVGGPDKEVPVSFLFQVTLPALVAMLMVAVPRYRKMGDLRTAYELGRKAARRARRQDHEPAMSRDLALTGYKQLQAVTKNPRWQDI